MAEQMTELDLMIQERRNSGAWTRNEKFDKNGYLVIKDLWDPEELCHLFLERVSTTIGIRTPNTSIVPVESRVGSLHDTGSTISYHSHWYSSKNWKRLLVVSCIILLL